MGNTNNNSLLQTADESAYKKFITFYQLKNKITIHDFKTIFSNFDSTFIDILCNYYSKNDEISEANFDELMEHFDYRSSEKFMKHMMKICHINNVIRLNQAKLFLKWMSFSCNDFVELIINSYLKSLGQCDEFDVDNFLSWLDREFGDFGTDFARSIYRVLNTDYLCPILEIKLFDNIVDNLNSSILNLSDLLILFNCLPRSFTSSMNKVDLSLQHCENWDMLYNSHIDGSSTSKMLDKCFDYTGPVLVLMQSELGLYCLASDVGLKEDFSCYGGMDARFLQLRPFYRKYLSGSRAQPGTKGGIIYSHFTSKSGRHGLFAGHNPLVSPALEIDEHCSFIKVLGHSDRLRLMEVWAVGTDVAGRTARFRDLRKWEHNETNRQANRKLHQEKWSENPDRDILDWSRAEARDQMM